MSDNNFSEIFSAYIQSNLDKCPELLMPNFRIIPAEHPFPSRKYLIEYDRLDIKAFLGYLYPTKALHTSTFNSKSIQDDLKQKYSDFSFYDTNYFFQTRGVLTELVLADLKFYQDEIDLRGRHPFNGPIDEPIWVVEYPENNYIIYNGYHRACYHLVTKRERIMAYVLKV